MKKNNLSKIASIMVLLFSSNTAFSSDTPFYPIPGYLVSKTDGVKPNVMLLLDSSGSMNWYVDRDATCRGDSCRLPVAKRAITQLVNSNSKSVNWGFSSFHVKDFTPIAEDNAYNVVNKVDAVKAQGGTPTPSIYYQLLRYYQGLSPTYVRNAATYYGDWSRRVGASSPISYRCQKNFIIVISDGDSSDGLYASERSGDTLFDGLPSDKLSLPSYAKRAFTTDFKTSGVDREGGSWQDTNFLQQNVITYTIGFSQGATGAAQNLKEAADAAGGEYYSAADSSALVNSLQKALGSIAAMSRAGTPPVYTSDDTQAPGEPITVQYNSSSWGSEIFSYGLTDEGKLDLNNKKPVSFVTGPNRNIWFKSKSTNKAENLQKASLPDVAQTFNVTTTEATKLVRWLQGSTVAGKRKPEMIGDVINSNISTTQTLGKLFTVGSNAGMIHVFQQDTSGYKETFAYMPTLTKREKNKASIGQVIPYLMDTRYGKGLNEHRYLVDGGSFYRGITGDINDPDFDIVVGSTGRGGAGIYALDMAQIDTTGGNADSVLYDLTNGLNTLPAGGPSLNDLGFTVGTPLIAKIDDGSGKDQGKGKWVTIFSSGYFAKDVNQNADRSNTLYFINLKTGVMFNPVPVGDAKGLSSPTVVDIDNDGLADYAYVGDLKGDLYRVDLSKVTSGGAVTRVFKGDDKKPITSAPAVFHKDGRLTVVFGTGRLLTEEDNSNLDQQSFYGIIDDVNETDDLDIKEKHLVLQEITEDSMGNRTITSLPMQDDKKGWMVNLGSGKGERVVYQPLVSGHTVFFTSQTVNPPASNKVCDVARGGGYLMSLDALTGGHPKPDNSHFSAKTGSKDYFAGIKTQGAPSGVTSAQTVRVNRNGLNGYGQVVTGKMDRTRALDKDPWYATGQLGKDLEGLVNGESSIITSTETGPLELTIDLPKGKSKSQLGRRISWRLLGS